MGRYYNSTSGDINGKFGFGVQSSDAGTRFGMEEIRDHITLYTDNKEEVLKEINKLFDMLGVPEGSRQVDFGNENFQQAIYEWAEKVNLWHYAVEEIPEEEFDDSRDGMRWHSKKKGYVGRAKSKELVSGCYDLLLGLEIYNDILKNGYCELECEL